MANIPGKQPDIKYCPACKGELENVPRAKMRSKGHRKKDGSVSEDTHTYICLECKKGFEIDQHRNKDESPIIYR